jgi:hypothetical protein
VNPVTPRVFTAYTSRMNIKPKIPTWIGLYIMRPHFDNPIEGELILIHQDDKLVLAIAHWQIDEDYQGQWFGIPLASA